MTALLLAGKTAAYEQDLRELLMAFFPGERFCYEKTEEAALWVEADEASLRLLRNGRKEGERKFSLSAVRKENKTILKKALYELLSERLGEELPWGTLTGIRPVKLPEAMLEQGMSDEEVLRTLRKTYLISEEKGRLITETAHRERTALSRLDYRKGFSLYIGIPFCPTTCMYCSFTSYPVEKWRARIPEYIECLRMELRQLRAAQQSAEGSILSNKILQTVYIGGGTPTALSAEELSALLTMVREELSLSDCAEFTVEAGRPDSITEEKLQVLRDFSVDRISINPQTMNQKTLDLIGRRHTVDEVKKAYAMARRAGFSNINMDLIMGLPEETVEDVRRTLSEVEKMVPDSLTIHALAVKRAARLNVEGNAWAHLARAGLREAAGMTAMGAASAKRLGLHPYYLYRQKNMAGNQENVGYASEGKENLYNILMMEELHTVIGCGAGSSSKAVLENENRAAHDGNPFRVERFENIKNIAEYLPRIGELLSKKEKFLTMQK